MVYRSIPRNIINGSLKLILTMLELHTEWEMWHVRGPSSKIFAFRCTGCGFESSLEYFHLISLYADWSSFKPAIICMAHCFVSFTPQKLEEHLFHKHLDALCELFSLPLLQLTVGS